MNCLSNERAEAEEVARNIAFINNWTRAWIDQKRAKEVWNL